MSSFVSFALLSGAFGAVAASLAKLAFSDDTFLTTFAQELCQTHFPTSQSALCGGIVYALRGLCFVGTLLLNIFMVGSFLEGMEESGSIAGTGLSSASNFVVSSLLGFLFWQEDFTKEWLLGFSLVIVGSLLLSTVKAGEKEATTSTSSNQNKEKGE